MFQIYLYARPQFLYTTTYNSDAHVQNIDNITKNKLRTYRNTPSLLRESPCGQRPRPRGCIIRKKRWTSIYIYIYIYIYIFICIHIYIYIYIYIYISNCLRHTRHRAWFERRKHTGEVDMRRAYAIGLLDNIEDTSKLHMYWLNVQGSELRFFVVCCLLLCFRARVRETIEKRIGH